MIEEAENEDSISYQMSSVLSGQKHERGGESLQYRFSKLSGIEYGTVEGGASASPPSPLRRNSIQS